MEVDNLRKIHNMIKPELADNNLYKAMVEVERFIQYVVEMKLNEEITGKLIALWWYI